MSGSAGRPGSAAIELTAVRTVLCDADGNLFPSEEPAFEASAGVTRAFLAQLGVRARFTADELRRQTTGKNFRATAVDLALAHGVAVDPSLGPSHRGALRAPRAGQPFLGVDLLERWVALEQETVAAHLAEVLRPDPAVLDPLHELHAFVELAAVSSSGLARLDACFDATGLAPLVPPERRFSAEDSLPTPVSKPDPAVYELAVRALGLDLAHVVAVEDSVVGTRSAVGAGVATIGNLVFVPPLERRERAAELRAAGAIALVESWPEVVDLLVQAQGPARVPS